MRRHALITAAALLLGIGAVSAQQYRTSYFMEGSHVRNKINPAFRPYRGYVDIPVIGDLGVNFSSNAFTVDRLLYPVDGRLVPFYDRNVDAKPLLAKLSKDTNNLDIEFNTTLIGFGFYTGKSFWTFDLGLNVETGFKLPYELFDWMINGAANTDKFDIGAMELGASAYMNASLGYSRECFLPDLILGARVNFIGGLARANVHFDRLHITTNRDVWELQAEANADVIMSGLEIPVNSNGEWNTDESMNFNLRGLSGMGLTIDLGAQYKFIDRVKVSAAVTNLGFMNWGKDSSHRLTMSDTYYWKGFHFDGGGSAFENDDDESGILIPVQSGKSLNSRMYGTITLGAEYDIFGNDLLGVGLIYSYKAKEYIRRSELSAALTVRPASWFTASVNCMIASNNKAGSGGPLSAFGIAVNFHPRWINFFVGTDFIMTKVSNQMIPVSQNMLNFYMGLAIPLAKGKY